jgi:hypothetical protein
MGRTCRLTMHCINEKFLKILLENPEKEKRLWRHWLDGRIM